MTRYDCSLRWPFLCLAVAILSAATRVDAAESRPNILFCFADDWGRHASVYTKIDGPGTVNDLVRTPNFDRLAGEGVLFRNAFVNAPSCTPCRSSLLSGQYFWRTGRGAILRGAVWNPEIPSYPLLLRDAGYDIGKSFKVWGPGTPADAPYGGQQYAFQRSGGRFNQFSQNATKMVAEGKRVEDAKAALLADARGNFKQFLDARDDSKPFCFWFGPTNVHRKWIKGSGAKLWGLDPEALKGKMPPFLPDVPEVRQDLCDYFGEIAALDAMLGELFAELRERGEYDNTLIVVSGDHGAPGFPHGKCNLYDFGTRVSLAISGPGVKGGRVVDDFVLLPDLAPTFLEAGGQKPPAVMTGRSLWPVLASDQSGQVDPERTWVVTGRERHVEMARAGYLPYPQRALRTAEYALIENFKPDRYPLGDPLALDSDNPPTSEEITETTFVTFPDDDAGPTKAWLIAHRDDPMWKPFFERTYGKRPGTELYDLKKDPHQMHNVADDPEYANLRDKLREQLFAELRRSGDPRMENDGAYFENPPLAGPVPEGLPQPRRQRRANRQP